MLKIMLAQSIKAYAGELRLFEDFGNGDKITSVDVEKSVGTALVKALEASWVSSIDDPRVTVIR